SLSAYHENLPHRITGKGSCIPAVPYFIYFACLEIKTLQQFKSFFSGDIFLVDYVFFIERPHVLIKSAESACRGADFYVEINVYKPYCLKCLVKVLRWMLRNNSAV